MKKNMSIQKLTVSALLIAVGMLIPMFSPFKIILEPASFTLASHVAIFIAMFFSPGIAAAVAIGTTLGFFLSGVFPIVVTLRAATHLVWALGGAWYLQKRPDTYESPLKLRTFSLVVGIVHAVCEVAIVSAFYFGGSMGAGYYEQGFLRTVMGLVGLGSVVHSMVDFEISWLIMKVLGKQRSVAALRSSSQAT